MDYHQSQQDKELNASLSSSSKQNSSPPKKSPVVADMDTCLEVHVLPSGDMVLVCKETGAPIKHLGKEVYISRANYNPADPLASVAEIKIVLRVPLKASSKDPFELLGKYIDLSGCNCSKVEVAPKGK